YVLVTDLNALDPLGPISPTALVEELIQGFARRAPASDYYGAVITFGDSTYTGDLKAAIRRAPWPRSVPGVLSQLPKRDRLDLTEMLAAAGRLIAYAGDQAATQVTALVSFGWIDAGDYPFVAAEALRTAGIRLYTYEAAPFHQLALLRSLARLTGGEYASFPAHRPEWVTMLRAHLADLCHLTHEEGGLVTADGAIVDTSNADLPNSASPDIGDDSSDSGGDPPDLARFESTIEKGCRSAVFTAEWDSDAPFEMGIDSPDDESFEESPQDAQARDPSDRFRVIDVESPSAGTWCTRIVLRRDEGPYRGPPVEVQHRVHVGASRVKFGLSVDQPSYSLGETVEIVGQVAAEAILSGVRMHGSITDPLGRVSGLDLVEVPSGPTGCRGEGSGFHRTRFTPTVEGPHEVIVVADNLDRSAVLATGGDSASEDVEFAWRPPAFTRRASVTVFVEDPPGPPCRATPDRLSRAEDTRVKIRFDRIPWIPGVSRLDLGDGVKAVEDLKAVGEVPTFEITVARGAAAGSRGAAVITSGKRFWIPRLLVIDR
ncbi:MAG: hypothetical protein ABFS86_10385, partial [Planctomycetota bacterium]